MLKNILKIFKDYLMPFSRKFYLPPEFIINSKNIDIIESSLTKRLKNSHSSLLKYYKDKFIIKYIRILKKIKYFIETRKIGALFTPNVDIWRAQFEIIRNFPEIYNIQLKMRKDSPLVGSYQFERLYEILKLLHNYNPSSILEYGSGTSSAMFARLIKKNVIFQTVDEMEEWVNKLLNILPKYLKKRFSIIIGSPIIQEVDSEYVISYNIPHNQYFDFVYVDGPGNEGKKLLPPEELEKVKDPIGKHLPNYDVEILWKNNIFPKIIVIDGRRSTVRRLIKNGQKKYRIYLRSGYYAKMYTCKYYYLYHTILIRKDGKFN